MITVRLRNAALRPIGVVSNWQHIEATKRWLGVGAWQVTIPYTDRAWQIARTPDLGVIFERDGARFLSGVVEGDPGLDWTSDDADNLRGVITLSGADDNLIIANRAAYMDPTLAWSAQTTKAGTVTGPLEDVILQLVTASVGSGAIASRHGFGTDLVIPASQHRGGAVTATTQGQPLMELIRSLQSSGGPLGVDVLDTGGVLSLTILAPRDLSRQARFARELGNLAAVHLSDEYATVTNALVAGSGLGAGRAYIERATPDGANRWRRIEAFVDDRDTADNAKMAQDGDAALAEAGGNGSLSVDLIETRVLRFGRDFTLGDIVSVTVAPGATYVDTVSQAALVCDAGDDESLTVAVGPGDTTTDDPTVVARMNREINRLYRRIGQLETGL